MKLLRNLLRVVLLLFIVLNLMAVFHAYKFTHFYDATNEPVIQRPEQMGFWQKTKSLFFGINYYKSVNKAFPTGAYQTINFKTKDGLKIESWDWPIDSSQGYVVMFHGHGSSKSRILGEAAAMRKMGYSILLVDFRAHGGSEGNTCTIGHDESEEVKLAYDYARAHTKGKVVLWGISLGAATITRAVAHEGVEPDQVILEMPFGSLSEAVKGRVRIMGIPEQPVATLLCFWGGVERGFWAFSHNPYEYAAAIKCPVLVQWGEKDPRVTRAEIDAIYGAIKGNNKKLVVYKDAGHESLYEKQTDLWLKEIKSFLN